MSSAPDVSSASVRVSDTVRTAMFRGRKAVSVICMFPVSATALTGYCPEHLSGLSRFVCGEPLDETSSESSVSASLHRIEAVWVVR